MENQNSLILIGEWDTIGDWENHLNSKSFSVLLGSLKLLSNRSNLDFSILSHVTEIEAKVKSVLLSESDTANLSRRRELFPYE